jgi:parvulin-like peptidyl-prolyl isomerase
MLQEAGLSEEQLKQKIREQLLAQKVIDREVRSAIVVSPYELTTLTGSTPTGLNPGEEVRASHLLVRVTDKRSEEEASALISQLYKRLLRGEDFAALARRYSEDPHAQDGGMMGWVHQGQLLPELDQALFRLEPGGLSDPIRTRLGFHLVKVIERRSLSDPEAAEVRQHLEQQLYQTKFADALSTWLGELQARAYIQILNGE